LDLEQKLLNFIKNEFISDDDIELTSDTNLISSGIIDSFSLVSLQSYIEREFGKKIPNPRMTAGNCDTINKLIELINNY
jgi:acyl carrier protein